MKDSKIKVMHQYNLKTQWIEPPVEWYDREYEFEFIWDENTMLCADDEEIEFYLDE